MIIALYSDGKELCKAIIRLLYTHSVCTMNIMSVFNMRLSSSDEKIIKSLRDDGVVIADVVRDAIRKEHELRQQRPRTPKEVRQLIASIEAAHPLPADLPPQPVNTLDRKAVRAYIAARIKNKRHP